jgi:hypothetical protein
MRWRSSQATQPSRLAGAGGCGLKLHLPSAGLLENIHVQVFYSMVEPPVNPPGQTQQPQARGIVTYLVPLL